MTAAEQAAIAAAPYLDFDPGFFLEQVTAIGVLVFTDGKHLHCAQLVDEMPDGDVERVQFLWALMKATRSGRAVRQLLLNRGLVAQPLEA